jgi:hypothetical protein
MFSIETKSGKSVRLHSYYKQEDEILLPPGIYLKVIGIFKPAEGLHIIQLREISPPYKMLADPFDLNQLKQALPESEPLAIEENNPLTSVETNNNVVAPKLVAEISSKTSKFTLSYQI